MYHMNPDIGTTEMSLAEQISSLLGGDKVLKFKVRELEDFNTIIRAGIPIRAATSLMKISGISQEELLKPLGISKATFIRKKKTPSTKLETVSSDRLYRIAYIVARTKEVFGNDEKAYRWLHKENRALNKESPFSKLDTEVGFREVLDVLERIEFGDYS